MKTFIKTISQWLNHRLRQPCWKRWKRVNTKFRMLRRYGIEEEEVWKVANSIFPVANSRFYSVLFSFMLKIKKIYKIFLQL